MHYGGSSSGSRSELTVTSTAKAEQHLVCFRLLDPLKENQCVGTLQPTAGRRGDRARIFWQSELAWAAFVGSSSVAKLTTSSLATGEDLIPDDQYRVVVATDHVSDGQQPRIRVLCFQLRLGLTRGQALCWAPHGVEGRESKPIFTVAEAELAIPVVTTAVHCAGRVDDHRMSATSSYTHEG